jgi:hypothetical protein
MIEAGRREAHRLGGIGKMNIEHPTSNAEYRIMKSLRAAILLSCFSGRPGGSRFQRFQFSSARLNFLS